MTKFENTLFKLGSLMMCAYIIWTLYTYNLNVDTKEVLIVGFICVNIVICLFLLPKVRKIKNYYIELNDPNVDIDFYEESKGINKWQTGLIALVMFEIWNIFLFIYNSYNHQFLLLCIICVNMFLLLTIARTLCHMTIKVVESEDF